MIMIEHTVKSLSHDVFTENYKKVLKIKLKNTTIFY